MVRARASTAAAVRKRNGPGASPLSVAVILKWYGTLPARTSPQPRFPARRKVLQAAVGSFNEASAASFHQEDQKVNEGETLPENDHILPGGDG
jgi:hypothetical protein